MAPLVVSGLRIAAGGRTLLAIEHLTVESGSLVGVLGPNGAGKTTLLRAILGLRPIHAGRIALFGVDIARCRSAERARLRCRVGYVPQAQAAHALMPLTLREVVAIGCTGRAGLLRPLSAADWRNVDRWLERCGLASHRDELYANLSGGEQRRALWAAALVGDPELLVLDEPAAHLDLAAREQFVALLSELHAERALTTLLVCHELEVLPAACQRVVLLADGRVVADGPPGAVLTDERVAALYGPGLRAVHAGGRYAVVPAALAEGCRP